MRVVTIELKTAVRPKQAKVHTDIVIDFFATVGLKLDKKDQLYMCIGAQTVGLGSAINIEVFADYKEGRLGKKVLYSPKASATGGIPSFGCEVIASSSDSAVTYVVSSADTVAFGAKLTMLMLDQAFNK